MSEFKYKALIFDFDGVLVDSVNIKGKAFVLLYEAYGEEVQRQVLMFHEQNGGVSRREKFKHFHGHFLGKKLDDNELQRLCDQFESIVESQVTIAPSVKGATEFLEKYFNKMDFYVASATPVNELQRIIDRRKMSKFFKSIYGAPLLKTQNVKQIIDRAQLNKKEVVMVGDAETDYQAAMENSIDFIGVSENKKQFPTALAVLGDLTELVSVLCIV